MSIHRRAFEDAVEESRLELVRAYLKHGENSLQSHTTTDINRLATLAEEFGEVGRALTYDRDHAGPLAQELIQLGTMALSWASLLLKPYCRCTHGVHTYDGCGNMQEEHHHICKGCQSGD